MTPVLLSVLSLLSFLRSFRVCVTCLKNINVCSLLVKSRLSLYLLKTVHFYRCSWVSFSPVMQCLQCILFSHWDNLFPFIFSIIWHLYLNQSLASASVMSCRSFFQFLLLAFLLPFLACLGLLLFLCHFLPRGIFLKLNSSVLAFAGIGSVPMIYIYIYMK